MNIGFLLPSILMHERFGKGRIFAPGYIGITLVNGLVDRGHKVFFYTAPSVSSKAQLIAGDEQLLKKDLNYYLFRNRSDEERKYVTTEITKRDFEYALTLKAYKDALLGKLDIIHSYHDFGAHYFNELTGFPTVYTLHDPMPISQDTIEYHRLKRFSHHNYVSISNYQRNNFPINFVSTVYHGLDLSDFEFGEGKGGYFVHFGRIMEDKGTHIAIEAAEKSNVKLKIASSKNLANVSEDYYETKIKPKFNGNNIVDAGYVEGKAKSDYIKDAAAFIFPLLWDEPFGLVIVEAMACGTPVVAYNRGSVSELVRDGVTGFIVDPDDQQIDNSQLTIDRQGEWIIKKKGVEGLVEAVKRIGEIDRLACRKHVEENFTGEQMVNNYEKVYKQVLQAKK